MPKETIAVTGASGYIATWIVKKLVEQGYTVHGTVRSLANKDKVAHLEAIQGEGTLKLFEADLLVKGSFDKVFEKCDIVMHTASPFFLGISKDPMNDFVTPALQGTENVLESVSKVPSIKKVILTSSTAAIFGNNIDIHKTKNNMFTEDDWNTSSTIESNAYSYSKAVAEKRAWEIAEAQNHWKLVVINPGGVLGPSLSPASDSGTISLMKQICAGGFAKGVPQIELGLVDVQDVADAHIKAAFQDNASGRYILVEKVLSFMDVANILKEQYADKIALPKKAVSKFLIWLMAPKIGFTRTYVSKNIGISYRIDNSKSKRDLGIRYNNIKQAIVDHAAQILSSS